MVNSKHLRENFQTKPTNDKDSFPSMSGREIKGVQ
jgi:hypothetical protein